MGFKMKGHGLPGPRQKKKKSPFKHQNPEGVWHNDRQPNPENPAGQFNPSQHTISGTPGGSKLGTGKKQGLSG
jgi:hypothetical protein